MAWNSGLDTGYFGPTIQLDSTLRNHLGYSMRLLSKSKGQIWEGKNRMDCRAGMEEGFELLGRLERRLLFVQHFVDEE
jgi:hypothetical protein